MKKFRKMIQTTFIGGFIFLIPLVVIVAVVGKAISIMQLVAVPLGEMIPVDSVAGVGIVPILTAVILVVPCLLAGMAARSSWGRKVYKKLDDTLLQVIPAYAWVKGMTSSISDEDAKDVLKPVLIRFDDQSQLGFEVDRAVDGSVAVFLPGAPDPRSGAVSYVAADRVQPVDVGVHAITKICKNLGRNSVAILAGKEQ